MTNTIRAAFERYIELNETVKSANAELKQLKAVLIAAHAGNDLICEDGIESKISHCTKKTPDVEAIQIILGRKLPEDCFSTTNYDQIRVKKVG